MNLKESLLQLLFPRVCPVCGEVLDDAIRSPDNPYICKYCHKKLVFIEEPVCMKCGARLPDDSMEFCANCEGKTKAYDRGVALLAHDEQAKKILYDLKYAGLKDNADFLGKECAERLDRSILHMAPEAFVPVPLYKKRQFERGFNQAELLAERLSSYLEEQYGLRIPVDASLLSRAKKTQPQKELSTRQREENVEGKFCVVKEESAYRRVMLIDDIYTSGATINECAKMLKQAGIKTVYFLTMSIVC